MYPDWVFIFGGTISEIYSTKSVVISQQQHNYGKYQLILFSVIFKQCQFSVETKWIHPSRICNFFFPSTELFTTQIKYWKRIEYDSKLNKHNDICFFCLSSKSGQSANVIAFPMTVNIISGWKMDDIWAQSTYLLVLACQFDLLVKLNVLQRSH